MNVWLNEIEIAASNSFGKRECKEFIKETRSLVDGVYKLLDRNVRSRYRKVVVLIWPQWKLDEFSIPIYEFDSMGGVFVINYAYDLNVYLNQKDQQVKLNIVYGILRDAYKALPDEVGLTSESIMSIVDKAYGELL